MGASASGLPETPVIGFKLLIGGIGARKLSNEATSLLPVPILNWVRGYNPPGKFWK